MYNCANVKLCNYAKLNVQCDSLFDCDLCQPACEDTLLRTCDDLLAISALLQLIVTPVGKVASLGLKR